MTRRLLLRFLGLGVAGLAALVGWRRSGNHPPNGMEDPEDEGGRVRFVCCEGYDNHGSYSPAVYLRVGGGRDAFNSIREAAPFLRPGDSGSAAAGLCGFFFNSYRYDGETGGTLSLDPPPQPGADGKIDWDRFGGDGDVILIDVKSRSARCCFGALVGEEVHDLALGRRQTGMR